MKNKERLYTSVFLSPFSYLRPSVRTEAYVVLTLLILQVAMLFLTKSFDSLIIIASSLLSSYFVDFVNKEKNYRNSFTIIASSIRGLIIGLMLPSAFPPVAVFFVSLVILLINKHALGGFANSWVNPVAVTVAVCWIIGMKFFPEPSLSMEALNSKNIALSLIQNGSIPMNSFDVTVTNFLNRRVFSLFGVVIPEGYFSFLWDSHSSIPAFRFNLLTLLSSIVLFSMDVINPIIPVVFICTYSFLVKCLAPCFYNGLPMHGDVLLALLSSGTLFSTFFLLQWHGTAPFTSRGKWVFAIFAGVLAFFILGIGLSPAGFAFLILITNVLSIFIQGVENHFLREYTSSVLMQQVREIKDGSNA